MKTLLISLSILAGSPAHADPDATDVRSVAAFHGLRVTAVIDVDVTIGATTRVELRGPKDWLAKLETRVEDGSLVLAMPGHYNHVPKLHATITTPGLDAIVLSGVGDIQATKLAEKALDVKVSGVGTVTLTGAAGALELGVSGVGDVHAKELTSRSAHVHLSGNGNAQIRATEEVDASVSGIGNIVVVGKPATVRKHVSGMGHVRVE
ncbi:MAG: head GIN domain-containing protein [Kofleriaceae bacterium]